MTTPDPTQNSRRDEYASRLNRVLDYIDRNLQKKLTLEELAGVANFSRFHFHRIFRALMGETLNQYIQRIRIEKAASRLIDYHGKSITEIALECGFSSSAAFARAFREAFGMNASEWRSGGSRNFGQTKSKDHQILRKRREDFIVSSDYTLSSSHQQQWRITMKDLKNVQVVVKDMPEFHVAYIRHIGPYHNIGPVFERLMKWAGPRGLLRFPETQVLGVYYDNPDITAADKLRSCACITVPKGTDVEGEVSTMTVPGGKYAVAHFEINEDQFSEAWDAVLGGWLPESGYQPDDRPSYELCLNDPKEHPEKNYIVDICFPVKPL